MRFYNDELDAQPALRGVPAEGIMGYDRPVAEHSSFDLNGREFAMVSSSASTVNEHEPTRFTYYQRGALVWGDYTGDTVTHGRFVGELHGEEVGISFAHELVAGGEIVRGEATSTIVQRDGGLYLVEKFDKEGVEHESVCAEV